MSAISHLMRDMKVTVVYLASYLHRRVFRVRATSRNARSNGMRVSMHAGSLGHEKRRKGFTGIGRSVDAITACMFELNPDLHLRMYTEGEYGGNEAAGQLDNVVCRTRTSLAAQLGRDMATMMPDIVHLTESSQFYSHLIPALIAPVGMLTVHDAIPIAWPGYMPKWCSALYRSMLRKACARCAVVFVHSEFTRSDLQRITGMECRNVVIVPLGVDPRFAPVGSDAIARVRERYELPERFVLTVGRCAPHKNIERLVQAMQNVRESGTDVGLMIAGTNDGAEGTRALNRLIEDLDAASWVRWPGFVDDEDLPALYGASAAFAFPSLYEGFGLPLLEAMACEVPVITSGAASLPEVAGDAALIVNASDVDALSVGLLRILNDVALRAELVVRGKERSSQYRWENSALIMLDAYNNALRNRLQASGVKPLTDQP